MGFRFSERAPLKKRGGEQTKKLALISGLCTCSCVGKPVNTYTQSKHTHTCSLHTRAWLVSRKFPHCQQTDTGEQSWLTFKFGCKWQEEASGSCSLLVETGTVLSKGCEFQCVVLEHRACDLTLANDLSDLTGELRPSQPHWTLLGDLALQMDR